MKRLLKVSAIIVSLFICALLVVWYFVTVPVWTDKNMRDAMASPDRLRQHVIILSDEIGIRPHDRTDKLDETADYILNSLTPFGRPHFQEFEARDQSYKNVILRLQGQSLCGGQLYVVGTHYDTVSSTPGADDNASGVAGIIELAKTIAQHPLPCDVELVAYSLEEPPNFRTRNMGSFHHAQSLEKNETPPSLMISLEMIGYFSDDPNSQHYPVPAMRYAYGGRGDFIGIVGDLDNRQHIRNVKQSFIETGQIKTEAISAPSFVEGIDFSDHQNYLKFGYPAIMISDTSFYRNARYHQASDTYDTLDYEKMAAVVDSVFYALQKIMDAPSP